MKTKNSLIVSALVLLLPHFASAETSYYSTISTGAWKASFTQEGAGLNHKTTTDPSLGLNMHFGVQTSLLFFELSPVINFAYIGTKTSGVNAEMNDVDHYSIAINGGLSLPLGKVIDIRPYVGAGWGMTGFMFGASSDYRGFLARAGAMVNLHIIPMLTTGVQVELQRQWMQSDEGGSIPSPYSAKLDSIFAGLVLGLGK